MYIDRRELIQEERLRLLIRKSIKTVSLNELLDIFPSMLQGKLSNKILIDVNK